MVRKKMQKRMLLQIVLTQKEMQSLKNTKDMLPRKRKRRKRKMKSRKRNPHLVPHLTAALLQARSLKGMEEKVLVIASILQQHHLSRKNLRQNPLQKANEVKKKVLL